MRSFKSVKEFKEYLKHSVTAGRLRSSIVKFVEDKVISVADKIENLPDSSVDIKQQSEAENSFGYRISVQTSESQVSNIKKIFESIENGVL